jgi:nitrite reductase/ring-hydroxylating ferredoxin subunit
LITITTTTAEYFMAESHLVAKTTEIPVDEAKRVIIGDLQIAVFNLEGSFYATDDVCTHAYASLSEGYIEDGCVECPLHAGLFDIKTGKAQGVPVVEDLKTFPIRIEGEDIYVEV